MNLLHQYLFRDILRGSRVEPNCIIIENKNDGSGKGYPNPDQTLEAECKEVAFGPAGEDGSGVRSLRRRGPRDSAGWCSESCSENGWRPEAQGPIQQLYHVVCCHQSKWPSGGPNGGCNCN